MASIDTQRSRSPSPTSSPGRSTSPQLPPLEQFTPLLFRYHSLPSTPTTATPTINNRPPSTPPTPTPAIDLHATHDRVPNTDDQSRVRPTMAAAVVSIPRAGISGATRPPMLPLQHSSLTTFNSTRQHQQEAPIRPPSSPQHPAARTQPAHRPTRDATRNDHLSITRHHTSSSTFGRQRDGDNDLMSSPPPPVVLASEGSAPSSLPTSPAETPRPTRPGQGQWQGARHVDQSGPAPRGPTVLLQPPSRASDTRDVAVDERPTYAVFVNTDSQIRAPSQNKPPLDLALASSASDAAHHQHATSPSIPEAVDPASHLRRSKHNVHQTHGHHHSLSSMTSMDPSAGRLSFDDESVSSATELLTSGSGSLSAGPSTRRAAPPNPLDLSHGYDARPRRIPRWQPPGQRDMDRERKAQLVRSTRKLERVLGEPLQQKDVEQYVIEPTLATTTITTSVEHGVWPDTPTGGGRPEWERDDVVPRYERIDQQEGEPGSQPSASSSQAQPLSHQRSLSAAAMSRVRSLIGVGNPPPPPAKLIVTLTREVRTTETRVRSHPHHLRQRINRDPHYLDASTEDPNQPVTPDTPHSMMTQSTTWELPEEVARRQRRQQLAKRLLGEHVPHQTLQMPIPDDDLVPRCTPQISSPRLASESSLSLQSAVSGLSISTTESNRGRLAARVRSTVHQAVQQPRGGPSGSVAMEREQPTDLARTISPPPMPEGLFDGSTMSPEEKALARKRMSKLHQMFGERPPSNLYLPIRRPSVEVEGVMRESVYVDPGLLAGDSERAYAAASAALSGAHNSTTASSSRTGHREALPSTSEGSSSHGHIATEEPADLGLPTPSFARHRYSIRTLMWLVENDQERLATIVDEIAELDDQQTSGSPTPTPLVGERERRERSASLSSFEGRHLDYPAPNKRFAHYGDQVLSPLSFVPTTTAEVSAPLSPRLPRSSSAVPRSPRSPIAFMTSIGRRTGLRSPVTPTPLPDTPDVTAHAMAARRRRKLTSFFGERIDAAHAHGSHSFPSAQPPRPLQGSRSSVRFGRGSLPVQGGVGTAEARRREETFDNVLVELWRNIQSEAQQGRIRAAELGNLRDMWNRLRRQRAQTPWEEL